ncbi:MAG: hypothetical protein AB7O73_08670 [Bacteroidia bacterium]
MSCRKETVTNWDIDVTGPVVTSKLNIKNFISDSLFVTDANNNLILNFNSEIAYLKLDSLIKLPDTTFINNYLWPSPQPSTFQPGSSIGFLPPAPITFNLSNGASLKWGTLRKGTLSVNFSNTLDDAIDFYYKLPGVTKYGIPFNIIETVPPGNNSLTKSYDLSGYDIDLTGGGQFNYNTLIQNYTVNVNPASQPIVVAFGKGASVNITYSELIPQYIHGYFGTENINIATDTSSLDVFNSFNANGFQLSDATLDFRIINEIGAEFSGVLNTISSINSINQTSVSLSTQALNNININRAYQVNGNVNSSVKLISLNKNNSNIVNFLSNLPNQLTYGGQIKINPLGNTSAFNDFAYYNTGIRVLADINIPLKFNANYFSLESDASINFSTLDQLENVNYGQFIINAVNGYPFDAIIQTYLLDENKQIIDSLFLPNNNTITKGIIDAQNIVIAPKSQKLFVSFDNNKLSKLKQSKSARIKATLLMPPNPPEIILKDHYEIDMSIVLDVNYKIKRK